MSDYIVGRNAVMEQLKKGENCEKLFIQKGELKGSIHKIIGMAKAKHVIIQEVDHHKLDEMAEGENHQGVALLSTPYKYYSLEEILEEAKKRGEDPFLVALDEITDPHNVGAIIRSAEAAGAHGIILPKRRSASITAAVHNTSAGATTYMKICRVTNLTQTLEKLKKENIWIYGADGEADLDYRKCDFSGGVCLVIGNEGKGISRLVKKTCDVLVSIPMLGHIESLNASASATVLLYEVMRNRHAAD